MVSELLKMCLPLNRFLARALSVQIVGGSPQERDNVLLETKVALAELLKLFSKDPHIIPLLDIQRDLCKILLTSTDLETMDVILRVNTLVSYGLEHLPDLENIPIEILEFITTVVTQEEIRRKILSFLVILSKVMVASGSNNVYLEHLFKLDEDLSKTLTEKEEDNKLDSLCGLSFLLTEFMATDYPDDKTGWMVQLNHLASQTLVEKFEDPRHLFRANNILSQAMRKFADKPFFGELIELNCILSSVILMDGKKTKYNQLIGWKLLLTQVMQVVKADDCARHFKKSALATEQEETELARLTNQIALVTQERDEIKAKARGMEIEIVALVKQRAQFKKEIFELMKDNIALNAENKGMKTGQKQDEAGEDKENIPVLPDVLDKAIPEEGSKKAVKEGNLEGPEEKSEEASVQQLVIDEMKDEGVKVSEIKSEGTAEGVKTNDPIAGVSAGEKNVTEELAGSSKGQSFKKKKSKKKDNFSGENNADKKPGPGTFRGQRSKKK